MTDFENTVENCDFCGYAYHIKSPEWYGWYDGWDASVCTDCHNDHEAMLAAIRNNKSPFKDALQALVDEKTK